MKLIERKLAQGITKHLEILSKTKFELLGEKLFRLVEVCVCHEYNASSPPTPIPQLLKKIDGQYLLNVKPCHLDWRIYNFIVWIFSDMNISGLCGLSTATNCK